MYTLIIDNSRHNRSTHADLHSSSLEPSTPTYRTLFHRSRCTTLGICLPCRINHPGRAGLYPADSRLVIETPLLGILQTCKHHYEHVCERCLVESSSLRPRKTDPDTLPGRIPTTNLRAAAQNDTDEYDRNRNETVTCSACRQYAVAAHTDNILASCARSSYKVKTNLRTAMGSLHGPSHYISHGLGTAKQAAMMAVEEVWLSNFARWDELLVVAHQLQSLEYAYMEHYKRTGRGEEPVGRAHRHALLIELWGEDALDRSHMIDSDIEMNNMFTSWATDIKLAGEFTHPDEPQYAPPQALSLRVSKRTI